MDCFSTDFTEAQAIKHMECIRPKLNAVADNAEFWRLLNQANAETIKRQSKRNCGAAQPAPHDQDWITRGSRHPPTDPVYRQ